MIYTFNHFHLKGLDPAQSAEWYVRALGAEMVQEGYITSDESISSIIELAGVRFFVTGPPPGATLTPGDSSKLGFYSGGLRYGLDHIALTTPGPLEEGLKRLTASGAEVLLPPRVNRHGATTCFIKGPDETRIEIVEAPSQPRTSPTGYTLNHIHVKGLDPAKTAAWYGKAFDAEVVEEGYLMSDGSIAFVLTVAGLRLLVSGAPPGGTLTPGDTSELGFYTGGLRYGLDHFAIDLNGPLEEGLKRLTDCGAEVLLPRRVNRYGLANCFIKGPDETRIEVVEYPKW